MSPVILLLISSASLAYALVAGVFLAFSDFIMRALAQTPGPGGIEAMQSINRAVFRWVFMALFLGLVPVSLLAGGYGLGVLGGGAGLSLALGAAVYVVGCFGVTAVCNVPMNKALADMEAGAEATQAYWRATYLPRWTFWNTLRALACACSACLMLLALALI